MSRIVTIILYELDELEEKLQKEAIELYREKEILFTYSDEEALTEYFKDKLVEKGYPDSMKVYWSLSYSQGDGVCVDLGNERLEHDQVLSKIEKFMDKEDYDWCNSYCKKNDIYLYGTIKHSGRYCHSNSFEVYFEFDCDNDIEISENVIDDANFTRFNNIVNKLDDLIKADLQNICGEFETYGYEEIKYHSSDEYIKEEFYSRNLEIELDSDGNIVKLW